MSVLEGGVSFGFKYSENHCDVRHRLFARFDSFRRLDRQINVRQGRSRLRQRKYGYDQHVSRAWKKAGIIVLVMDMFKGTLTALLPMMFGMHVNALLIGLSAIIGHVFPIFAGFKGGKAVATSVGVLLVYNPEFFLIAWVIFLITLYVSSMVSVASMVGFTLITFVSLFYNDPILTIVALALTIFIFIRHWGNIERIKNGTENMVHFGLLYRKKQKENK